MFEFRLASLGALTESVLASLVARGVLEAGFTRGADFTVEGGPVHIRIVVFKERLDLSSSIGATSYHLGS